MQHVIRKKIRCCAKVLVYKCLVQRYLQGIFIVQFRAVDVVGRLGHKLWKLETLNPAKCSPRNTFWRKKRINICRITLSVCSYHVDPRWTEARFRLTFILFGVHKIHRKVILECDKQRSQQRWPFCDFITVYRIHFPPCLHGSIMPTYRLWENISNLIYTYIFFSWCHW